MKVPADFDAVVLANGDFPTHEVPLRVLQEASLLVCCDGAANQLLWQMEEPVEAVVVGDGDSLSTQLQSQLHRVTEQDDNDLTKATRYCMSRLSPAATPLVPPSTPSSLSPQIAYLGCTGRREDHTLGNLSLMVRYLRDFGIRPVLFTDYGWFTPAQGERAFASFAGQQVSIFNFGSTHIHSEGLKWDSYAYGEWWQGTLNEALADRFTLRSDGYYMVYQTYE